MSRPKFDSTAVIKKAAEILDREADALKECCLIMARWDKHSEKKYSEFKRVAKGLHKIAEQAVKQE